MEALALLELDSIAAGFRVADAVAKKARVDLLESRPLDPGKYLILFRGDVASVEASFREGVERAGERLVDRVFLPAAHESILPLLGRTPPSYDGPIESIGVVETAAAASTVLSADAAAKTAPVRLLRVHLARRTGGKGYFVITGPLADVEAAVSAGAAAARDGGKLVGEVVIPSPAAETLAKIREEWLR
ncbi:MAG: BMC domain-containing protein [Candidatus Eisenbacteria bacterium]